jgi:hypothetical protein
MSTPVYVDPKLLSKSQFIASKYIEEKRETKAKKEGEQVAEEKPPTDSSKPDSKAVCDTGTTGQQPIDCNN